MVLIKNGLHAIREEKKNKNKKQKKNFTGNILHYSRKNLRRQNKLTFIFDHILSFDIAFR